MSYIDSIPEPNRQDFTVVNTAVVNFLFEYIQINPRVQITKSIKISNKIFIGNCTFTGNFDYSIEFKNCYFKNDISFSNVKFERNVVFNNCFCDASFYFDSTCQFESNFDLISFSVLRQIVVLGGEFKTCRWSVIDNGKININGGSFLELRIGYWGNALINHLHFDFRKVTGQIFVTGSSTKIDELFLSQSSTDLSLTIEDLSVNYLGIYRFRNDKSFTISNIKALNGINESEFAISESFLGKCEFYSIDFNHFKKLYLRDVHLVDCLFMGITWNFNIQSFHGRRVFRSQEEKILEEKIIKIDNDKGDDNLPFEEIKTEAPVLNYYKKNREVFRQLKFAYSKQGDAINEQKFHSKEMLAYNRSLTLETEPVTKIIIKLSYWFSDFGQSIGRPIFSLALGHLILLLILISCDEFKSLSINFSEFNSAGFTTATYYYFYFINPLHKSDDYFKSVNIVIDILMRIWSSYMIYNIVRASRRFIK